MQHKWRVVQHNTLERREEATEGRSFSEEKAENWNAEVHFCTGVPYQTYPQKQLEGHFTFLTRIPPPILPCNHVCAWASLFNCPEISIGLNDLTSLVSLVFAELQLQQAKKCTSACPMSRSYHHFREGSQGHAWLCFPRRCELCLQRAW